jgi:hypothetical protein
MMGRWHYTLVHQVQSNSECGRSASNSRLPWKYGCYLAAETKSVRRIADAGYKRRDLVTCEQCQPRSLPEVRPQAAKMEPYFEKGLMPFHCQMPKSRVSAEVRIRLGFALQCTDMLISSWTWTLRCTYASHPQMSLQQIYSWSGGWLSARQ